MTGHNRSFDEIKNRAQITVHSKMYKVYEADTYFALRAYKLIQMILQTKYNSKTAEEIFEKCHTFREKILYI